MILFSKNKNVNIMLVNNNIIWNQHTRIKKKN